MANFRGLPPFYLMLRRYSGSWARDRPGTPGQWDPWTE
jgi:hypothetical protein